MSKWAEVADLDQQYNEACSAERWADIAHRMEQSSATKVAWDRAREVKGRIFFALCHAVKTAMDSGEPLPTSLTCEAPRA